MSQPVTPLDPHAARAAALKLRLGAPLVDDFLAAAEATGRLYLPLDEDPVFGFLQRMLSRLRNAPGGGYGLIFPKRDPDYQKFFDYFDGEGRIYVVYPEREGEPVEPTRLRLQPEWVEVSNDAQAIAPAAPREIVLAFLSVYAALREAAAGGA